MLKTKAETKSGASSVGSSPKKCKAPAAQEQKPRCVTYKELLLAAEIPEEEDAEFDPPFIPPTAIGINKETHELLTFSPLDGHM